MDNDIPYFPDFKWKDPFGKRNSFLKKNFTAIVFVAVVLIALPISLILLQNKQIIFSHAATDEIMFLGPSITPGPSGSPGTTTNSQINIQIQSPFGGITATPTPSISPSPS